MRNNYLIIKDDTFGGKLNAVNRLLDALGREYSNTNYLYLEFKKRQTSSRHLSFVIGLIKYYLQVRNKIIVVLNRKNIDYVIVSDYLLALAAASVKTNKTRIIFLFHGLGGLPFRKITDVNYRQILIKILERLSWILSDIIVVASKESYDYISRGIQILLNDKKMFIVPNIIPEIFFYGKMKAFKTNSYNILYSGRIDKYKGLENLILAFYKVTLEISSATLIIAHPVHVNTEIFDNIKNLISELHLGQNIKFIKGSTERKLIKLYSLSDISILPSELEFEPLCVLESLATGTPIIATKVGNVKSVLSQIDPALILKNNSSDEIARALLSFYSYRINKKKFLSKKSKQIARKFTQDISIKEFNKVLDF